MPARFEMRCEIHHDNGANNPGALVNVDRWVSPAYFIWKLSAAQANAYSEHFRSRYFDLHHRATWNRIEADLEALGDGPERLNYAFPEPPYSRATVSLRLLNLVGGLGVTFRVCTGATDLYIDKGFGEMWKFVTNADPAISVFWRWDVYLRDDSPSPVISPEPTPAPQPNSATPETGPTPRRSHARTAFANLSYCLQNNSLRRRFSRK
ncbi:hypothetical protein N7499_007057 [Penicillium canescens]|nr:hypothetical protein N7499_007057 [Penicillium canescens]KAJ6176021.1 hypothetical protein N7485_002935 [Penicillium canescens]